MVPDEQAVKAILAHRTDLTRLPQELATRGPASRFDEVRRLDERFVMRLLFCRPCRQGVLRVEKLAGPPEQKVGMTVESHPVDSMMVEQLLA
jgi:hypothetical protein